MTNGTPRDNHRSPGARRALARAKARDLRASERKRTRTRKVLVRGGIAAAVLAAVAVVVVVLVTSIHPPQKGPANMASDGILIGTGGHAKHTPALKADAKPVPNKPDTSGQVVNIVTYVDYECPYCGQFERTNRAQLQRLITGGAATIEIHPVPFFASGEGNDSYSLRSANAAACVADYAPDAFWAFNSLLFQHQPKQGKVLTNARIKDYVAQARASKASSIDRCIDRGTYTSWAQAALARASDGPLPNTAVKKLTTAPLVLVDGQRYTGSLTSASDFRAFLLQVESESYEKSAPEQSAPESPAPTPTATGVTVGPPASPTATATTPAP